jgi:hypothetical protein
VALLGEKPFLLPFFYSFAKEQKAVSTISYFLGSISPTFYERLFHTKVARKAFLCVKIRLNFFWRKEIDADATLINVGEIDH